MMMKLFKHQVSEKRLLLMCKFWAPFILYYYNIYSRGVVSICNPVRGWEHVKFEERHILLNKCRRKCNISGNLKVHIIVLSNEKCKFVSNWDIGLEHPLQKYCRDPDRGRIWQIGPGLGNLTGAKSVMKRTPRSGPNLVAQSGCPVGPRSGPNKLPFESHVSSYAVF